MDFINFLKNNPKRVVVLVMLWAVFAISLLRATTGSLMQWDDPAYLVLLAVVLFVLCMMCLVFILPSVISYNVIRRLANDNGPYSILPLFDNGYSIALQNVNTWLLFTTPIIQGTIAGFPVTIRYEPSSKSRWSYLEFEFSPLAKEGSRRIYGQSISFTMYLVKKLRKDVKPEILQCIDNAKKEGLVSGADKPLSTKHFDSYAD